MKRRDVLKTSSLLLGYTITGGTALAVLNGCQPDNAPDWTPVNLSPEQAALAEQLSDTILPATETAPGATIAQVVRYIDAFMDCYDEKEYQNFLNGLSLFEEMAKKKFNTTYKSLDNDQRLEVMEDMMGGSPAQRKAFREIRKNTIVGFCYSEVGATQVLKHDPIPGHPYKGCVDLNEVGGTWSITR